VVAIGYSYDGKHDFSPYEYYTAHTETDSSFDMLGRERSRFGTTWAYDFGKLKNYHPLTESNSPIEELGLQPKDHLFNIEKVANSQLLCEVKRKTFDDIWEMYKDQLHTYLSPWHLETAYDVQLSDIAMGDPYEGLFPQFDKGSTLFIYDSLYGSEEQILQKTHQTVDRIVYPVGEINDAVEALTDRKYEGMDIITTAYGEPTGIYYDVQDRIFGKLNRGEDLNRLERLTLSVGAYLMGGKQADIEERIESILINRFQKKTRKAALGFSGVTEDFQEWKENNRDLIEEIKNDLLGLAEKKKSKKKRKK